MKNAQFPHVSPLKKKSPPFPEVGAKFAYARKCLGWTQEQFAEFSGYSVELIQKAEGGKSIKWLTHSELVETLNGHDARPVPPPPPVEIPYPSKISAGNPPSQVNGSATPSGRPLADPLSNPSRVAATEILRHMAKQTEHPKIRLGEIRSVAELCDLWRIDNSAYPDGNITFEHFLGLWKAFPSGIRVLFHENEILGALGLWPVTRQWAERLKTARLKEAELDCRMVRQAARRPASYWYVTGLLLREELIGRGACAVTLLKTALGAWLKSGGIRFPCEILAIAYSDHGSRMLKRFNFHIVQYASAMPDNCDLYGLPIDSREVLVSLLRERNLDVQ